MKYSPESAGRLVTAHLQLLFPEEASRTGLLDWMAYQVQRPGYRLRWTPLVAGPPGCGKTTIFRLLAAALGESGTRVINPAILHQRWNDWLVGPKVVAIEELWATNQRQTLDKLKDLVTNDQVVIDRKFQPVTSHDLQVNFICFTGHPDALCISEDDRRWFVLKTATKASEIPASHFAELADLIATGGDPLNEFFLCHKISKSFTPMEKPSPEPVKPKELWSNGTLDVCIKKPADAEERGFRLYREVTPATGKQHQVWVRDSDGHVTSVLNDVEHLGTHGYRKALMMEVQP